MKGQSFVNFLREQDGKADRQKVLSISAIVGSSVLAQLMFVGAAQAGGCPPIDCMATNCANASTCGCGAFRDCINI